MTSKWLPTTLVVAAITLSLLFFLSFCRHNNMETQGTVNPKEVIESLLNGADGTEMALFAADAALLKDMRARFPDYRPHFEAALRLKPDMRDLAQDSNRIKYERAQIFLGYVANEDAGKLLASSALELGGYVTLGRDALQAYESGSRHPIPPVLQAALRLYRNGINTLHNMKDYRLAERALTDIPQADIVTRHILAAYILDSPLAADAAKSLSTQIEDPKSRLYADPTIRRLLERKRDARK